MTDKEPIKVLLVEDDEGDAELFRTLLPVRKTVSIDLKRAESLSSALDRLTTDTFDIIMTDLGLPESRGIETFLTFHAQYPDMPVIVLTGMNDEELALEAVKKGAQDYLVKGEVGCDMLLRSIQYSIERQKLLTQLERSLKEIKTLKGLIPVCAWCRKIRDDKGYWKVVEKYIEEHTDAAFTHGICPECIQKTYPEIFGGIAEETTEILGRHVEPIVDQEDVSKKIRVLLIEDNESDAELIREIVSEAKDFQIEIEHSSRLSSGIALLGKKRFDVVLTDLELPDSQGFGTFIKTHSLCPDIPIIVLTGLSDENLAVEAVRSGAQDYLVKGQVDSASLVKAIRYSIERQRLLTELESKLKEISKLERERKNLLSMFAHDIKNALVPSIGFLTRLLLGRTENLTDDLTTIRDELMTAERLLANFINFSRFDSEKYRAIKKAFNIEAAIRQQVESSRTKAEQKKIRIEYVLSEQPFPAIMADEGMLQRVIANLLDNAIKYTSPEGTVTVKVMNVGNDVLVKFQDTGIGISNEHIPYIFDAFYRATDEQRGSGLGLSIARTIIEAHGGEIWVESTPGEGSTFSFTLPKS
jgi:signal transduction histidine kinase